MGQKGAVMEVSFFSWLKSEFTANFYRATYRGSREAFFPKPSGRQKILFIIGSGASVDDLTQTHWDLVDSQTSIGINFWTTHTFAPTIYALEKARGNTVQALEPLISEPERAQGARVLWFGGPNRINRQLLRLFKRLGGKVWFYGGWPLREASIRRLEQTVSSLTRVFQMFPGPFRPAIDLGNTVSRLVSLAAINGWQTIVLLGVDLGGAYFNDYRSFSEKIASDSDRDTSQGVGPDSRHRVDAIERGELRLSAILPRLDSSFRKAGLGCVLDGSLNGDRRLGLDSFSWQAQPE